MIDYEKLMALMDSQIRNAEGESEYNSIAGSSMWSFIAKLLKEIKEKINKECVYD